MVQIDISTPPKKQGWRFLSLRASSARPSPHQWALTLANRMRFDFSKGRRICAAVDGPEPGSCHCLPPQCKMLSHSNRPCFAFTPEHLQGLLVRIRGCSNPPPLKSSQAAAEYTLQIPAQAWLSTTTSCASKPGKQALAALSQVEKGKPCWSIRIPRHRRLVEWEAPPDDAVYSLVQLGRGVVPRQTLMQRSAQHVSLP